MMGFDSGWGMFDAMEVMMPVFFIIVLGLIVFSVLNGVRRWSHNNAQPKIPAQAWVVAKRMEVDYHHHHAGAGEHMTHTMHTTSSTTYYATFEFASGDRLELRVPACEYGMLSEGDQGTLTSQGTRFIGFERHE